MKRIWNHPKYRPAQVVICILFSLVLIAALYVSWGCPTLSMRQEFRRAEKAHLVGPSKIVDTVTDAYSEYDKMFVGETEHGICFFGKNSTQRPSSSFQETSYHFTYREKTGDLTVAAAPNIFGGFWDMRSCSLPVYLFDEYPQAVRAELEVTISGQFHHFVNSNETIEDYKEVFHASATRTEKGFFRFILTSETAQQSKVLAMFSNVSNSYIYLSSEEAEATILAAVCLFDAQGNLILERDLEITA